MVVKALPFSYLCLADATTTALFIKEPACNKL